MPRSDSQRLTLLQRTRDAIEDALHAEAGSATVVSYTLPDGRTVNRDRAKVMAELQDLERRIQSLERRLNGSAVNRLVLRRRA